MFEVKTGGVYTWVSTSHTRKH